MKAIEHIDEIVRDAFGLWITGLFGAIVAWNPTLTFEEHKAAFFGLVERLLREGRIKFIAPGADCYTSPQNLHPRLTIQDEEAHWHAAPEKIVEQLKKEWPSDSRDENDPVLITYFYSMPGVIWIADDGTLVAS